MRRVAEGVATIAYRKGISARPKDLVSVTCAEVGVVGTVKFKRVGESFRGDHAPYMHILILIIDGMADRRPRKPGGEIIVVGPKQDVAGIRTPVVM
eukprot:501041-Pelagomonas_calceolata.AAC.1